MGDGFPSSFGFEELEPRNISRLPLLSVRGLHGGLEIGYDFLDHIEKDPDEQKKLLHILFEFDFVKKDSETSPKRYLLEEMLIERFLPSAEKFSRLVERHISRLEKLYVKKLTRLAYDDKNYTIYGKNGDYTLREYVELIKEFIDWYKRFLADTKANIKTKKGRLIEVRKSLRQAFNLSFGARLREARKKRKYSANAIARMVNISPAAYSNYECGLREPPLFLIVKLATILGISLDWLLDNHPYSFID